MSSLWLNFLYLLLFNWLIFRPGIMLGSPSLAFNVTVSSIRRDELSFVSFIRGVYRRSTDVYSSSRVFPILVEISSLSASWISFECMSIIAVIRELASDWLTTLGLSCCCDNEMGDRRLGTDPPTPFMSTSLPSYLFSFSFSLSFESDPPLAYSLDPYCIELIYFCIAGDDPFLLSLGGLYRLAFAPSLSSCLYFSIKSSWSFHSRALYLLTFIIKLLCLFYDLLT